VPVTVLGVDDTIGAATGLGTMGGATGVANEQIYYKIRKFLKGIRRSLKVYP